MSVARSQIDEVLEVLERYVPYQVTNLLTELAATEAYKKNRSYRETIDRLLQRLAEGWKK